MTNSIRIHDTFWGSVRETVRREGIPYQWKALNDQLPGAEPSYCMRNFRIASGKEQGKHGGCVFQDSDVAKWLEGVAYTLAWHPDEELERIADGAIDDIVAAQQSDGYLDTYYIINGLDKRWTNLRDHHELYCAGHMLEAAVAYYNVTGKRKLLDAMLRLVDHIDSVFGPEEGKLKGYPGHPVLEMALMRLYDVTHDEKHLKLAKYFVDQRGQSPLYFDQEQDICGWLNGTLGYSYYQAHKPVREQEDAVGHAVRALYLYAGMADVARETGDAELAAACDRLWNSVTRKRMYITGAVGSSEYGEAFTFDYDLPNDTVYGESCASIALVFFARRMLRARQLGEYADVMERALYNGVLSGMQLDGKRFFYVNPLEVLPEACEKDQHKRHVKPERQPWFGCACCPPNIIRLYASLEDYIYTVTEDALYMNLYLAHDAALDVGSAKAAVSVETNYPWDGKVAVTMTEGTAGRFKLALRVPGWCAKHTLTVNGDAADVQVVNGYAVIERDWQAGDTVVLDLAMPVTVMRANPKVYEDAGKVTVMRGPIVYCLEECDNGKDLHLVHLCTDRTGDAVAHHEPELLGGVTVIDIPGYRELDEDWGGALYAPYAAAKREDVTLRWVPYYAWGNRGLGEMRVWCMKGHSRK